MITYLIYENEARHMLRVPEFKQQKILKQAVWCFGRMTYLGESAEWEEFQN